MADNETTQSDALASLPAGVTFGFDDVDGVKIARSKTGFGENGTYTDASATNPLPVVDAALGTLAGAVNESAPGSDTASAGLNGRLQRIAQRLSSIIALLPTSLGAGGGLKVDGSGTALPVSLASVPSHAVTNAGTFATQATLQAGTNAIGKLAANSGVDIGDVDVTSVTPGTSASSLGKAEDAAHTSGDVGVMALAVRKDTATQLATTDGDYSPLITNASGALHVAVASGSVTASGSIAVTTATSGGATPAQFIDVDESEDEVKGSAGTLYSIVASNVSAGTRYLKIYDGTAAGVTVGSTTPKWTVAIPAGGGFVWESSVGMAMGTGITIAATTGVAVADTGAPGANDVIVNVTYA